MKKLDLSPVAPGISMYAKAGTFTFLQLAYQEGLNEIITSRIGSSYDITKGYILNGCLNTGTGLNYIISAGSIFFNGEVYLVPAATFTIVGPNVAEGVITTTQYPTDADPTDFTDGVQRNVHNIRQIVFSPGLSGSGAFDFVNLVNLQYKPVGAIGQTIEWIMPGIGSQNSLLPTYFNVGTLAGIHPLTLGWNIDDGGIVGVGYLNGDTTFGTIGATGGEKTHLLTVAEGPTPAGTVPGLDGPHGKPADGGGAAEYYPTGPLVTPANASAAHNNMQPYKVKLKITRVS